MRTLLIRWMLVAVVAWCATGCGAAAPKLDRWMDGQGKSFRGIPAEVLGPFALFLTENNGSRRLLLRQLSPADCVRFSQALPVDVWTAGRWSESGGLVSRELVANVDRLVGNKMEAADVGQIPEPRLFVLLICAGESDRLKPLVEECIPLYARAREIHGGFFEMVYLSVRRSVQDHVGLARLTNMPWLIADIDRQAGMRNTLKLAPAQGQRLWVVNRDGVPLLSSQVDGESHVKAAFKELDDLLLLVRPLNRAVWPEHLHYYTAVRAAQFATGKTGPMLIGTAVRPEMLREHGIMRLRAMLAVDATGNVSGVEIDPVSGLTAEHAEAMRDSLRRSVFAPAVEQGRSVEGDYEFVLDTGVAPGAAP